MRWSDERILTTPAASLPRPPELVRRYVRRAHGEAVDPAALAAAGRHALRWVVPRQIAAGIDVGNNGEQQREGFFLYEDVVWAKLKALAEGRPPRLGTAVLNGRQTLARQYLGPLPGRSALRPVRARPGGAGLRP